jgi:hypothetical protein
MISANIAKDPKRPHGLSKLRCFSAKMRATAAAVCPTIA